jgi:hypothetical protein
MQNVIILSIIIIIGATIIFVDFQTIELKTWLFSFSLTKKTTKAKKKQKSKTVKEDTFIP